MKRLGSSIGMGGRQGLVQSYVVGTQTRLNPEEGLGMVQRVEAPKGFVNNVSLASYSRLTELSKRARLRRPPSTILSTLISALATTSTLPRRLLVTDAFPPSLSLS